MNPISPTSLFHFTSSLDVLLKILNNGFRYSYAFERFSTELLNDRIFDGVLPIDSCNKLEDCGIAIPMVSFCDIPITRTLPHAEKYGNYFIGLNKGVLSYLLNPIFNPVIYGNSSNLSDAITFFSKIRKMSNTRVHTLFETSKEELETIAETIDFSNLSKDEIMNKMPNKFLEEFNTGIDARFFSDFLLALYKPVSGLDAYGNECYFYDEREWRAVAMDNVDDDMRWVIGCSASDYLKYKDSWNQRLSNCQNAYITLKSFLLKYVSHIGVAVEDEVKIVAEYIMNGTELLFGCDEVPDSERLELVSKLTSFERIENDY